MTEERLIRYYRPRIQIPVETMQEYPGEYALYCLPVAGANALLRIVPYLRRTVTYVSEIVNDKYFRGPNETVLNAIWDICSEMEESLRMGANCQDIVDAINNLTTTMTWNGNQTRNILTMLKDCTCAAATAIKNQTSTLQNLSEYVDAGSVTYGLVGDTEASYTPPSTNQEKCEWAQSIYWYMYEQLTEVLLPYADQVSDQLLTAVVATGIFGSLAGFVGLPIALVTAIVTTLIDWAIDGAIVNVTNWLVANRDEMICELYNGLPNLDAARQNIVSYVEGASGISYLDGQVILLLMSTWHMGWVRLEQETNGTWDPFFVTGQCDDCQDYPAVCNLVGQCNLSNWSGGNVECIDNKAVVKGGNSQYTAYTFTVPSNNAYLRVYWTPRAEAGQSANFDFGLVLNGTDYGVIYGATGVANVQRYDDAQVPSQLWGQSGAQLFVLQHSWWCQIDAICIQEGPFS